MANYLEEVEEQLVELTERGAHRRRRRGPEAMAVAALVAVVAAVAVAVASVGSGRRPTPPAHRPSPPPSHRHNNSATATRTTVTSSRLSSPGPVGGPVPSGFAPQSFTAISGTSWWLLGSTSCSRPPCTFIVRTTDGGQTFVALPGWHTRDVSQVRFADSRNGFAYDPELWVTHDGGGQWRRELAGVGVSEVAASGAWVYAIAGGRLERAPVASDRWSVLPGAGNAYAGLWVQGREVMLESTTGTAQKLMISDDSGQTFTSFPVPPSVTCQFQAPSPPVLWAHCATGMMSATWRSPNGGQTFLPSATRSLPGPVLPNSSVFAAASAGTAVVGWQHLYRTTNGGADWTAVDQPKGIDEWLYLGFTDATHGVGLALVGKLGTAGKPQSSHEMLFYTTDGGASYHAVPVG